MTSFYIGYLDEVKPTHRKDKTTGQVQSFALATLTFQSRDNEGYLVKSTEQISFPIDKLGDLQNAKGKYLLVPYTTINTKNGTFTFPDDSLDWIITDKNPLELLIIKK